MVISEICVGAAFSPALRSERNGKSALRRVSQSPAQFRARQELSDSRETASPEDSAADPPSSRRAV